MKDWLYEGKVFEYTDEYYGFIYEITNLITGRKYIGRKYLTSAGYKTVKGKRKKVRKESDWKKYCGSSPNLTSDIEEFGIENFSREIIKLCKTRAECSYFEAKIQFERDVLLDPNYYNGIIQCRINSNHLKHLHFKESVL